MNFAGRTRRAFRRGLSLVEMLIVLSVIALIMGAVVVGSGRLASARMSRSATMIAGAVRVAFTRATSTSRSMRLVFDLEESAIWLEQGEQPMLVQTKDTTGTGGAEATTVAEKAAVDESARIVKGPSAPRPSFTEVDAMGVAASDPGKAHKALERGIAFRSVQTSHDEKARTTGRAYLYFWPGGQTERAVVQLNVRGSQDELAGLTLLVSPLTGKVTVKTGRVELATPADDKEASEREDPGAF